MVDTAGSSKDALPDIVNKVAQEAVIFAVMGTTGSGKSTFIQKASGRQDVPIGHELNSCTLEPYLYDFTLDGRSVALLDTPGFDDTYRTDAEVLQGIADFLSATYKSNLKLSGIVYLQRITDPRMTHGGRANLVMFRALCGDDPLRKVVLATTFWGEMVNKKKALQHEEELKTNPNYWGDMLSKKATMAQFHDTQESALNILRGLMEKEEKISLQIQQEMIDQDLDLSQTTAGEFLNKELNAMAEKYQKDLERYKKEMDAALAAHDVELREIKEDQARKTQGILEAMQNQKEVLNARRRDEIRLRDMQFRARLRQLKEQEAEETLKTQSESSQAQIAQAQAQAEAEESEKQQQQQKTDAAAERALKIQKRGQRLEILGAVGTTATAAGLAVLNPLAIPVAFEGLIRLINACFSRRDRAKEAEVEGNRDL